MYYELHITFNGYCPVEDKRCVEKVGWKYSKIDGDPKLGDGVKSYATKHLPSRAGIQGVHLELKTAMWNLALVYGLKPIRAKIELVQFDETFPEDMVWTK